MTENVCSAQNASADVSADDVVCDDVIVMDARSSDNETYHKVTDEKASLVMLNYFGMNK